VSRLAGHAGTEAIVKERFELVLDPTDLWTIWDNETDQPVVFANQLLAGLSKSEAEAAYQILVEIVRKRELEKSKKHQQDKKKRSPDAA
jgi:predicted ABC-type ATPase